MELRSRGALKVVWRSSEQLMWFSLKGHGKASDSYEEDDFWPRGTVSGRKRQARFSRSPASTKGEDSDLRNLPSPESGEARGQIRRAQEESERIPGTGMPT